MAFRKLQQIVRSTIRSNHIGFAKSSEIHMNILTPVKMMNPNTEIPALILLLRHIHKAAFLSNKVDCVYHMGMPLNKINLVPASKYIKSELPLEELSRNVVVLSCDSTAQGGKCDVYLVGTDHMLKESAIQVKAIINHLKPEVVFLELCKERAHLLTYELTPQDFEVTIMDGIFMFDDLKDFIECYLYGVFAKEHNVVPGSEFRVAYQEAKKYGAKVILGDRPQHITRKRGWGRMSLFDKTKRCFSFKPLKFPALWKADVDERDQYMSSGLLKVASRHSSVVAVVGRGHLNGIEEYWKKPIVIDDLL